MRTQQLVLVSLCAVFKAFSEYIDIERNINIQQISDTPNKNSGDDVFYQLLSGAKRRRQDRMKLNKSRKERRKERVEKMCWNRLDSQDDPVRLEEWQCQPKIVLGRVILPKKIRRNIDQVFMYNPVEVLVQRCSGACPHGYGLTQTCLPQNSTSVRKKDVTVRVHLKNLDAPICVTGKVTEHLGECICGCGNREIKRCREQGGTPLEGPHGCSCNM